MRHGRKRFLAITAAWLFVRAAAAAADSGIDGIEHIFGATNINAVTGHGRLAEGVSIDGDVTVVSWPNPSYADQLAYISSNDFHARSLPRLGAPDGAGMFLGLLIEMNDGSREVTWLRDRTRWEIEQSYGDDDGANVVTRHRSAALGLTVAVTDAVQPPGGSADVLVRALAVERTATSPVHAAWLLTYANLSPMPPNARIPELPITDWLLDGTNDFAALWDAAADAVVHFHPQDQLIYHGLNDLLVPPQVAYGPIGDQLQHGAPDATALAALVAGLDAQYAPGSYAALTTRPPPDQHQIGFDATPLCAMRDTLAANLLALPSVLPGAQLPVDPGLIDILRCGNRQPIRERQGWVYDAADAYGDAADGELQGSDLAAGEVNEALRTPLTFAPSGDGALARAGVVLAFGPTAADATAALASVASADQVVQAATAAFDAWLTTVRLPDSAPPAVQAVARRSLINLRVGTDLTTGAIVASIARQPPYFLDWPRDGGFFNVALEVSGQHALAGQRADAYVRWQRQAPARPTPLVDQAPPRDPTTGTARTYPAGAWEMNYYADGMPGGPIRFEIDNAGLALWTIVTHVGWVASDPAGYLSARWDAIARTADLLARWHDPGNGLQAPASEDDNTAYTQGLKGAVTVYGALNVAARAARFLGRDSDARRWEQRACELHNAVGTQLYDPQAGLFVGSPGERFDPAHAPTGETAWLVWPMRLLPWDDALVGSQLSSDLGVITPTVRLETAGGSYFMKTTAAAAIARGADPVIGPIVADLRDRIAATHPTPLTRHFGESMLVIQTPDGPQASQRVATPHLWEGILFYLTAMGIEDPGAFDRYDSVLPPSQVPPMGAACPAAVTCAGDCDGDGAVSVDELLTGVNVALGNAALSACTAFDLSGDGTVTVDELLASVSNAVDGCAAGSATPSRG